MIIGSVLVGKGLHRAPADELPQQEPLTLPHFQLESARGPVTEHSLTGHWTVLFFGYTQCPDVCPTTLTAMKSILGVVKKEQAPRPQVIFVSVDPGRDTPQMLDRYVRAFDPEFIGATASDDALAPLTRNLGVFYQRDDAGGKPHYTVDHTATLFLLDPKGRLRKTFSPPFDVADIAARYIKETERD